MTQPAASPLGPLARYEWRRLFSELLGTFILVPAA